MKWQMLFGMGIYMVQMGSSETHIIMAAKRTVQISSLMVTQTMMRLLGLHYSKLPVETLPWL